MALSNDLFTQFAKVTKEDKKTKKVTTVYGTVKLYEGAYYLQIDGSDILTPTLTTADIKHGERVTAQIDGHSVIITGNMSSPAARTEDVQNIIIDQEKIESIEADNIIIHEKLDAVEGYIKDLEVGTLTAEEIEAVRANIESMEVIEADIKKLSTDKLDAETAKITYATIENLYSAEAEINNLKTIKLSTSVAKITYATIESLNATNAKITSLQTSKLDAETAKITYADINFANIGMTAVESLFSKSGIIKDLVVGDTNITGELVGVTIKGDLIEGNTIAAEKLVVKGEDGLYYKLNIDGETVETEQTDYNSLNGSIITAKSITASKINVTDLVAFGATIGGFKLTENSIYSGVKESVNNTTSGIYLDKDGQIAFGDSTNFIKYYKDQNGNRNLEISANSIVLSSNNTNIESSLNEISEATQTNANDLSNYISSINKEIDELRNQIDRINNQLVL